jgi:hypothetical protein
MTLSGESDVERRRRRLMAFVVANYFPESMRELAPAFETYGPPPADGSRVADLDRIIDEGARTMSAEMAGAAARARGQVNQG